MKSPWWVLGGKTGHCPEYVCPDHLGPGIKEPILKQVLVWQRFWHTPELTNWICSLMFWSYIQTPSTLVQLYDKNDYVPNNIRANNIKTKLVSNNIKMKLVSNNIKIKPSTRLNNRTHKILFVIFILFPANLLNCE